MNDHDDHDFEHWTMLAPGNFGSWLGFLVFVAWIALGYWIYCT